VCQEKRGEERRGEEVWANHLIPPHRQMQCNGTRKGLGTTLKGAPRE